MSNIINLTCSNSCYIDKYHCDSNFKDSNYLLSGIIMDKYLGYNICKPILNFNVPYMNIDSINKVFLFLFVENMKFMDNTSKSICISGNYDTLNFDRITWNSFENADLINSVNVAIPDHSINSYIKIDITPIFKMLSSYNLDYNFVITPSTQNSIVKFSSIYSSNYPYINIITTDLNSSDFNSNFVTDPSISDNLDSISQELDSINSFNDSANKTLAEIKELLYDMNKTLYKYSNNFNNSKKELDLLNERISSLEKTIENINKLTKSITIEPLK